MLKKLMLILLIVFALPAYAQFSSAEPDTKAFVTTNFQLQPTYSRVLCVSQDGSCPAQIDATVPCLASVCDFPTQTYSIAQTFDTIQAAWDSSLAGDLIIITPGEYAGVQAEGHGGENGAYIHFLGWGAPGSIIINASADPTKDFLRHHFYFIDVHHLILQNLTFTNAEGAGLFVSGYFSGTGRFSHHIVVMNVYSHDNGVWGLHTTATSYMLIQDSIFTNSGEEHGAYISGSGDHFLIRRNVFQGNIASGLQVNADPQTAISELFYWLQTATGDTCGWTEEDATWDDLKTCYDGQGLPDLGEFIEDGISENIIIEQNVATANGEIGGAAINLASLRNSKVRNNLVYGNLAGGIICWDNDYFVEKGVNASPYGCQNVSIENNTLVDETGGRGSIILNHFAQNITLRNNVVIRDRFDAIEIAVNSGQGFVGNNNYFSAIFVDETSQGVDNLGTGDVAVPDGLAQFVNPNFELWVSEDGLFPTLNPNRPDYRPLPDSILATGGDPSVALSFDALGNPRTGTEIGALTVSQ